ncbi:MAG: hypothetical protein ICV59_03180 [Thermoleophilia bacterium]|nr:hypothetical protein [Thermoleophilia bacterium]
MKRLIAAPPVLALVLVLALGAAAALAAPSKGEFIRRGDALCTQTARELVPLRKRAEAAKSLPTARKWAAGSSLWAEQVRIQARFNARFRALGLPAGDVTARRLVDGLDRGLVFARRVRDAFASRSTAALAAALPAYLRFTVALNRRVQAYGFRVCGRT